MAQQHDYMKRLRRNGGARDRLVELGIALLSGRTDSALIMALKLGPVTGEEFISLAPETPEEWKLIRASGVLD